MNRVALDLNDRIALKAAEDLKKRQCEAITITNRRTVCGDACVAMREGHPVCWVHAKAAREIKWFKREQRTA